MSRVYISVESITYTDGFIKPIKIFWEDGRTWNIKRVLHVAEPIDNEFEAIRYTVLIGSAEKNIYRSGASWYVFTRDDSDYMEVDSS